MSDFTVNVGFDSATLERIAALENSSIRFGSHILSAIQQSLPELESTATGYMFSHFMNPQGDLESAWDQQMLDESTGALINTSPYAQRRNYGFSGMTDSLGRFYPNDPGILWAENTVDLASSTIAGIFQAEMELAASGQ